MLVGVVDEALDALAFATVDGNSNAGGEGGKFPVLRRNGVDTLSDAFGFFLLGFGQNQGKFIAAVAGGRINRAAVNAQSVRDAADRPAADKMTVRVVDFLQAIQIQE